MPQKLKKHWGIFLVILISLLAVYPLFSNGYFSMHDDTQPSRIFEMARSLKLGFFPARWVFDLGYGYGYPIFNFYAPFSYYLGSIFVIIGVPSIIASKITFILAFIASGTFMYFLINEIMGEIPAVIASALYIFAPYHAVDLYIRGDMAELWAYAFIPLFYLGLVQVFRGKRVGIFTTSIGLTLVVISHNLTAFMLGFFVVLFLLVKSKKLINKKILSNLFLSVIIGILMSSFYWLPALAELKFVNVASQVGGSADFRSHFVCLSQLWDSVWGYGGSVPGCVDGFSFRIGKIQIILSIFSLIAFLYYKPSKKRFFIFALVGLLFSIFMTLNWSKSFWELIPMIDFVQYPWRFLIFTSFFSSILGGFLFYILQEKIKNNWVFSLICFIVILSILTFNMRLFAPQKIYLKYEEEYISKTALNWKISKISDEYLPKNISKPSSSFDVYKGNISRDAGIAVNVENQNKVFIEKPQILHFEETAIEKASDYISLVGILALLIVIINPAKKKYAR